jgi:membrane-bound metal-dependent hydrolase YbcI (DUF457 family)
MTWKYYNGFGTKRLEIIDPSPFNASMNIGGIEVKQKSRESSGKSCPIEINFISLTVRITGRRPGFYSPHPKEVAMPQAGLHGMVVRKMTGKKEWLLLGILLGSFIPDMDNIGVAVATLTKVSTTGIHRTMTHSIFFMALVVAVFYILGQWKKDIRWGNLGIGIGIGMLLHALLDLLLWFNGVALFWPLPIWINLWANITPPEWFMKFMDPAEFLCFGLYLWILGTWAHKASTDREFMKTHDIWMWIEFALFVIFAPLAYIMTTGFQTLFGALYLFSIFMTFLVTIRMRKTVEAAA